MPSRLKSILKYLLMLALTVLLVWLSLRTIPLSEENKWTFILATWQSADKGWLMLMALLAVISHIIRAERWRMLLAPAGYHVKFSSGMLSLMIGYLVNLVVPRGGEVSRCYNIYKLEKTPVEIAFGTVVVERVIDLLCLVVLLGIAFAIESEKLLPFISTLPIQTEGFAAKIIVLVILLSVAIVGFLFVRWILHKNQSIANKVSILMNGFKNGLRTVFNLKRKKTFVVYTLAIWTLYFLMSYCVIKAFPETSHLGLSAVLALFAIGAIAMAAPLPGGAGSYHVLVPAGLSFLYAIPQAEAVAFTFVFHGWQTVIMIAGGAISLVLTFLKIKKQTRN